MLLASPRTFSEKKKKSKERIFPIMIGGRLYTITVCIEPFLFTHCEDTFQYFPYVLHMFPHNGSVGYCREDNTSNLFG